MAHRRSALLALVCALASGCASKLDFDSVSAGPSEADAGADLGVRDARAADVDLAIDANRAQPETGVHADPAGELPDASTPNVVSPRETDAAAPPVVSEEADAPDQSMFACPNLDPPAWLCDDFETLGSNELWSHNVRPQQSPPVGTLNFDESAARAGHFSLLAEVRGGAQSCDGNGCVEVFAETPLEDIVGPTRLRIEFDLRVERVDPADKRWITVLDLGFGVAGNQSWQTLQILSSGTSTVYAGLVEYEDLNASAAGAEPVMWSEFVYVFHGVLTINQWAHVVYEIDATNPGGAGNSARLLIDRSPLFDGQLHFPMRSQSPVLKLGIPWMDTFIPQNEETTRNWRVRFDNVVIRVEGS